jgi:transposase-like protein
MAKYRKYSKEFKLQAAKLVTEQGYSYDLAANPHFSPEVI